MIADSLKLATKNMRYDEPLVDDKALVSKGCVSSIAIMNQFPSGSIYVNLYFQVCNKMLKFSYCLNRAWTSLVHI